MKFWLLVVAMLSWTAACGQASEIVVAFGQNRPPFIISTDQKGLEIDIVREALKSTGHSMVVVQMPSARLRSPAGAAWSDTDAITGVRENALGGYISDSYIVFHNFAVTKQKRGYEINSVADLKGKRVVAWQHAWNDLGEAYRQLFGARDGDAVIRDYYEHPDQRRQVEMFWKERADVLVIDKELFLWQSNQLASQLDVSEPVVFHNIFPEETPFFVVFKQQQIRDDFNRGLRAIKSSGRYQQLLDSYLR